MEQEKTVDEVVAVQPVETAQWYRSVSYKDAKIFIRTNLTSAARSFIAVGYYLKHIRDTVGYTEDGFADIWEFAQAEYGISKSTASRYMTMNDRFSQGGNSPMIRDEYKEFGKSQLQEMLALSDEQKEWDNIRYSGKLCNVIITYMIDDKFAGIMPGYAVLGIKLLN
ncbi:MAG: DUF3850 domain-containing protein [Enterocloster asparagiformis]|nr:DUF3850 domain-containing protein [Enterocloster asparagiformis]